VWNNKEAHLYPEICVELPRQGLESGTVKTLLTCPSDWETLSSPCELVGTSVPAHVEKGVELVRDPRNGLRVSVSPNNPKSSHFGHTVVMMDWSSIMTNWTRVPEIKMAINLIPVIYSSSFSSRPLCSSLPCECFSFSCCELSVAGRIVSGRGSSRVSVAMVPGYFPEGVVTNRENDQAHFEYHTLFSLGSKGVGFSDRGPNTDRSLSGVFVVGNWMPARGGMPQEMATLLR